MLQHTLPHDAAPTPFPALRRDNKGAVASSNHHKAELEIKKAPNAKPPSKSRTSWRFCPSFLVGRARVIIQGCFNAVAVTDTPLATADPRVALTPTVP